MSLLSTLTRLRSNSLSNSLRALSVSRGSGQAEMATKMPKKPPTAWIRFFTGNFETRKRAKPNLKTVEIMRELASEWKVLPENQKERFTVAWQKDMKAYKAKLEKIPQEQIDNARRESAGKRALNEKNKAQSELKSLLELLQKPVKASSAYNMFVKDYMNSTTPNMPAKLRMAGAAEEYKKLPEVKKAAYTKKAEVASAQHKKDMVTWTNKMNKTGKMDEIMEAEQKLVRAKAKLKEVSE